MNVNDDKFQYFVYCRNKTINDEHVSVGSNEIMSSLWNKVDNKVKLYSNV